MTYKTQQSYDPGTWGRYNSNLKDKVMPGFQPEPPAVDDICGEYEIIFAASFTPTSDDDHPDSAQGQGPKSLQWHFRQKASGSLLIFRHPDPGAFELRGSFGIKVLFTGRLGSVYRNFRYGYNALGFVRGIYGYFLNRCSNALPLRIMGYNWGTRGHLYVVSERKAFPLIHPEEIGTCSWMDEDEVKDKEGSGRVGSSTVASAAGKNTCAYAQLIYNTRHYSFLCRELGLSCVLATLITQYIGNDVVPKPDDYPPYLYAEPGDIWMDSKLSSQDSRTRTYLLARRKCKGDDDDDNNNNVNQTNCCIQSRIVANMSPELLKIYWIVPPKMLSPIVNWMLCHPGKVPPRALTGLLTRLFRPHQNPNERRNHGGNSNNNIAAWNEEEGVVTRSRARRDREERERVLRPRLKRICYRT